MTEVWEIVRAVREWADLIGITLGILLLLAGLGYAAIWLLSRALR